MVNIEDIDKVVERTNVGYEKARDALEKSNNDVIAAIIMLEQEKEDKGVKINISSIIEAIKELLKDGTASHIQIKKHGRSVIEFPVILGGILVIYPIIALLGAGAIFICDYEIYILKEDGATVDVIKYTRDKLDEVKARVNKN
ncbi:MAG: DUF4342 domain-containing protein [Filifactoraceae bacterium]